MSEKIKLSELRAMRAAMTPGEYVHSDFHVMDDGHFYIASCSADELGRRAKAVRNAAGIVATHNAADALIDVVEAAIEYRDARRLRGFSAVSLAGERLVAALARFEP